MNITSKYRFFLLTLVIFTIVVAVQAQTGNFAPPVFYGVGPLPYGMTNGDFNGDGKPDLATANLAGNSISILINNGNGTFQDQVSYPVGPSPTSVAAGDFNNDNRVDLVTTIYGSNYVVVLLGNGDGTFQSGVGYGVSGQPVYVITTDLNHDNALDLVTANYFNARVAVLLGNGNGTFQNPVGYPVAGTEIYLTSADLNQDGHQDIVVSCLFGQLYVLFGSGNGTLQPPVGYNANENPIGVAAGNFNADNYPDLVVSNVGGNARISVLINNGNGTFQPPVSYSTSNALNPDVTVADFNLDGKLDIAAAGVGAYLSVFHGNGDGTFQAVIPVLVNPLGHNANAMTSADFDGNNKPDVAMIGYQSSNVAVLLNQCTTCDATAPTTTAATDSSANAAGWNNTNVGVSLSAADNVNGSGVSQILYSASGAQTIAPTTVNGASANLTITAEGETVVTYYARDNAGNTEEPKTLTVRIDKTAPVIVVTSPTAGNYLLNQNVTIGFNCTDALSGVSSCTGSAGDGASLDTTTIGAKTFTVNAVDVAGNNAAPTVVNYNVVFGMEVLFDQTKAHKSGSTVPVKIRLVDANGANVSKAETIVHAISVVQTSSQASTILDDAGNSNPDYDFRYDQSLGGYIFNLKTIGYGTGTYRLNFVAGNNLTVYSVQFQIRQ